jgi:hypothetical protein
MPVKIRASQIGFDKEGFATAVEKYIAALNAHRKTKGVAVPMAAHPLVEHAVRRIQYPVKHRRPDDFVADFEIVDDVDLPSPSPKMPELVTHEPPPPSLQDKKQILFRQLRSAEFAASEKVHPPHKLRLLAAKCLEAKEVPEEHRTADHASVLKLQADVKAKVTAIHMKGAYAEAEIDDLTEENIDQYKLPNFDE